MQIGGLSDGNQLEREGNMRRFREKIDQNL
jgi:hypothetical protein